VWHDSLICVTWLTHMCDMTHSYVWHDSLICVTWLPHMCDMTQSYVRHDSLICVTWLTHMCDLTHSYVWHDSLIELPTSTRTSLSRAITYVCRESFMSVTWLIHVYDMNSFKQTYRVAKTHRIPYLYRSFSAKVTYIQWLFRGKWSAT